MVLELKRSHRLPTFLGRFLGSIEDRVVLHELAKL
jgi:hypothetical protein